MKGKESVNCKYLCIWCHCKMGNGKCWWLQSQFHMQSWYTSSCSVCITATFSYGCFWFL